MLSCPSPFPPRTRLLSPIHSKDAEVWQEGGTSSGTTPNQTHQLAWVLGEGWCPQPSSDGSSRHTKRGRVHEKGKFRLPPPQAPPICPLVGGGRLESKVWAPERLSRKGRGIPGSSWVPKAPRKQSMFPRPAQGSSETCTYVACTATLAVCTHRQTEATAASSLRPWPQLSVIAGTPSSLPCPSRALR